MKQGEQLGRALPHLLVGLAARLALRLPVVAGIGFRLKGPRLILAPHRQTQPLPLGVGLLNQLFLGAASGSTTVTTPVWRWRRTVPVAHQVRSRCQG